MDKHVSTFEVCWEKIRNHFIKMETNCNLLEPTKANLLNLYDIVRIMGFARIYFAHVGIC
jgi:hypothetical protein